METFSKDKDKKKQVKNIKRILRKIETRGAKRNKNLERKTTYVIPTKVIVNMKEGEIRSIETSSKKRTLNVAINLTRESPPIELVLIMEELPMKKKRGNS
jgi:hypothetical protein